jgi:hypothetical protein
MAFVTTFLGAFLALGLTYFYDRYKASSAEQAERRKVMKTIRSELALNLKRDRGPPRKRGCRVQPPGGTTERDQADSHGPAGGRS